MTTAALVIGYIEMVAIALMVAFGLIAWAVGHRIPKSWMAHIVSEDPYDGLAWVCRCGKEWVP